MARFNDKVFKVNRDGSAVSGRGMEPIKVAVLHVDYGDISAASTTGTLSGPIAALDNDIVILGAAFKVNQLFGGGAVSDITVQYGDAGDPDELLTARDIFTDSSTGFFKGMHGLGIAGTRLASGFYAEASYADILTFTATGANLSALTQGSMDVFVYYLDPTDPDA